MVAVTWYDAIEYGRWLTERLRDWEDTPEPLATLLRDGAEDSSPWQVRLPGEAEREKAARGAEGRLFPWGDDADPNRANYRDTSVGTTSAVGCFPGGASPYGVEDLSGNVWEWCRTRWQDSYESYRGEDDLEGSASRVLRGGSFYKGEWSVRCAYRLRLNPDLGNYDVGFRLVVAPNLPSGL